jgi:AcrR family transcriptional regulator
MSRAGGAAELVGAVVASPPTRGGSGVEAGGEVAARARGYSAVAEVQHSRLLAAAIRTVEERGYADVTVAQITARARVSRRTFYELFVNCEQCLSEAFAEVVELVETELTRHDLVDLAWSERVRLGLWRILRYFDREPVLARFCVVHALRGGQRLAEQRHAVLSRLAEVVDEARAEGSHGERCTALTAEGLVGACFTIVHARLLRRDGEPLADLLGELMGLVVLPYLGPAAARREQTRALPAAVDEPPRRPHVRAAGDPLDGVPMRLTYRTARVLECIAQRPDASNREISKQAGIEDQGQISKLLARLERLGLAANQGQGHVRGERNAWRLTTKGELVSQGIRVHLARRPELA